MKQKVFRVSIASSATESNKKAFSSSIQSFRNAGVTIVRDWTATGEREAYILFPKGYGREQLAGCQISVALDRVFSGTYGS